MRVDKELIAGILHEMFSSEKTIIKTNLAFVQNGMCSEIPFKAFSSFLARRLDAVMVTQDTIAIAKNLLGDIKRDYLNEVGEVETAIVEAQEKCLHPVMKSRAGVLPGQVQIVTCQICGKILEKEICPV